MRATSPADAGCNPVRRPRPASPLQSIPAPARNRTHGPRMLDPAAKPAAVRLTVAGDKLVIEVPQHLASALQSYLRNNAVGTTLFLDQVAGDACLVLRNPANAGRVHALLTRWQP